MHYYEFSTNFWRVLILPGAKDRLEEERLDFLAPLAAGFPGGLVLPGGLILPGGLSSPGGSASPAPAA